MAGGNKVTMSDRASVDNSTHLIRNPAPSCLLQNHEKRTEQRGVANTVEDDGGRCKLELPDPLDLARECQTVVEAEQR